MREASSFYNAIFEIQNEPWSERPAAASVINPYLRPPALDTFPNVVELADALSLAWQARVLDWVTSEESSLPKTPRGRELFQLLLLGVHASPWSKHRQFSLGLSGSGFQLPPGRSSLL